MRHYAARQHQATGKWKYTCSDRHGVSEAGGCSPFMKCPDCPGYPTNLGAAEQEGPHCKTCGGRGVVDDPNACAGHDTAEEAYAHHKGYMLQSPRLMFMGDSERPVTLHRCDAEGCNAMTDGGATVGGYRSWHLCADHRTTEAVAALFKPGEVWES